MIQAMLKAFQRAVRSGNGNGKMAVKKIMSIGVELFKGVARPTPNIAEYWMKMIKRILEDRECTLGQKLKGVVSLLGDKAYRWWQAIVRGMLAERITWNYFQEPFQKNYMGPCYVEAHRREFIELKQGDMSVLKLTASRCTNIQSVNTATKDMELRCLQVYGSDCIIVLQQSR
ncbi:uncharacterized protein LOC105775323 [Gossypium raimondii]|uniref:uncharacterized protein LOC105775323 n=1 Tax=Gossypium raimondii TaxID=29730 RepID=UPI00063AF072|nr:uncharacterized protein LOC105775323 [Gossypium raimondii]